MGWIVGTDCFQNYFNCINSKEDWLVPQVSRVSAAVPLGCTRRSRPSVTDRQAPWPSADS